jgi:hypothetical protein
MAELKPFDFVDAVGKSKEDLIRSSDDPVEAEKAYNPWLTNLAFSMHADTVLYANEANALHRLPNRMQHDYYLHSLRPKKRFAKWPKKGNSEALEAVQWRYSINTARGREVLKTLRPQDVEATVEEYKNATGDQGGHLQRARRRD